MDQRARLPGDAVVGFFGGLAIDSQGNVIHVDELSPDATVDAQAIPSLGSHDIYLEKLSPQGELLWSRTFGSPLFDRTWAVTTDIRDAAWLTYVEGGSYEALSSTTVITKLPSILVPGTD